MKYISGLMIFLVACSTVKSSGELTEKQQAAQGFLDSLNKGIVEVYYTYSEAQWQSNIKIVEGDSTNAVNERKAGDAYAAYAGSKALIGRVQALLADRNDLTELQVRQLEKFLYNAANYAETAKEAVAGRIRTETEQVANLYGFNYTVDGRKVTTNDIDNLLKSETDEAKRLAIWN